MNRKVRANARQKTIDLAISQLKQEWDNANKNSKILFYEGDYPVHESCETAYLIIGDQIRWGYNNGFDAWEFGKNNVDSSIAGQKEYAWSNNT